MPHPLQPDALPTALDVRTHYVYRLFDVSEELLYVGIAVDPGARLYMHRREKPWWPEVTRTALETFPTRADAEYREAHAILTEHPRHNQAIPALARLDALRERVTQDCAILTLEDRVEILEYQLRRMAIRARTAEAEAARLRPFEARLREAQTRLAAVSPEEFQRKIAQAEVALELANRQRTEDRQGWLAEVHRLEEQLRTRGGAV